MKSEIEYTSRIGADHIKEYGQYFTDYNVANFMCTWACYRANTMLDPAVGNGVFFYYTKEKYPHCLLTGYEIDQAILNYFGDSLVGKVINCDYLSNDWDQKFDAIVCNPPYNRFQAISNRSEIIKKLKSIRGLNIAVTLIFTYFF